jgi:hypothetical protein
MILLFVVSIVTDETPGIDEIKVSTVSYQRVSVGISNNVVPV